MGGAGVIVDCLPLGAAPDEMLSVKTCEWI
jgi:hypothetical protein